MTYSCWAHALSHRGYCPFDWIVGSAEAKKKQWQGPQPGSGSGSTTSSVCNLGQAIVLGNISLALSVAGKGSSFASGIQASVCKAFYRILKRLIK